jgi:hypothetical protein
LFKILLASPSFHSSSLDGLAKGPKNLFPVIPAEAGIQRCQSSEILWTPVFTGETAFYQAVFSSIPAGAV